MLSWSWKIFCSRFRPGKRTHRVRCQDRLVREGLAPEPCAVSGIHSSNHRENRRVFVDQAVMPSRDDAQPPLARSGSDDIDTRDAHEAHAWGGAGKLLDLSQYATLFSLTPSSLRPQGGEKRSIWRSCLRIRKRSEGAPRRAPPPRWSQRPKRSGVGGRNSSRQDRTSTRECVYAHIFCLVYVPISII
jgi:hypothetical protein